MKLAENFNLSEMTYSETANKKGIVNLPNKIQIENLKLLCTEVLQPLRNFASLKYERVIYVKITSGFRCKALNDVIPGASKTSDHMEGKSADVLLSGLNKYEMVELVKESGISFDQCIIYKNKNIMHISYRKQGNRNQYLQL